MTLGDAVFLRGMRGRPPDDDAFIVAPLHHLGVLSDELGGAITLDDLNSAAGLALEFCDHILGLGTNVCARLVLGIPRQVLARGVLNDGKSIFLTIDG